MHSPNGLRNLVALFSTNNFGELILAKSVRADTEGIWNDRLRRLSGTKKWTCNFELVFKFPVVYRARCLTRGKVFFCHMISSYLDHYFKVSDCIYFQFSVSEILRFLYEISLKNNRQNTRIHICFYLAQIGPRTYPAASFQSPKTFAVP